MARRYDADNKVDPAYFATLTYTFISTEDRKHASYQPVIFFFNNFFSKNEESTLSG